MVNNKRKVLSRAITAAIGGLGMATAAQAVNLNSQETGEAFVLPYYTVQDGRDTYFQIVNTTGAYKALKVRMREGMNSKEVLDFNLYMSPYDVWTAAITATTDGAKILTHDTSCTVPNVGSSGVEFRTSEFSDPVGDTSPISGVSAMGHTGAARTREGYVEVIEMAEVNDPELRSRFNHNDTTNFDCSVLSQEWVDGLWNDSTGDGMDAADTEPAGGLFVDSRILRVESGEEIGVSPLTLDNFASSAIHFAPASLSPSLADADPQSIVFDSDSATTLTSVWASGEDAVSALIMRQALMNQYKVNPAVAGETDWVVNFPTRHFYLADTDAVDGDVDAPFTDSWDDDNTDGVVEACEPVNFSYWDREENQPSGGVDFSPSEETGEALCWEVNVLNFDDSDVLGSENLAKTINLQSGYNSGWARLSFDTQSMADVSPGYTYNGLPAFGFAASKVLNNSVGVGAAYASAFDHRGERNISAD